ncbi:MAG TPA: hypothetical protein PKG60_16395 [Spirochaetota bacterium]|mgnify:CR=1 FL=1|nr:hypothetical protein [Spirochaetota bacterium]HPS88199.1 hypothetical protein [Spirochaetota bacterium]
MQDENLKVDLALREIGDVLLQCLRYEPCPVARLDASLASIDEIISDPGRLGQCEYYFKAAGSNYILFFFSNLIYNLRTKNDLILTQDVLKWLASVWKNFIQRNKTYQNYFRLMDIYSEVMKRYYEEDTSFINKLSNVSQLNDQFIDGKGGDDSELDRLEKFFQVSEEISNGMRPTFTFLQDFFREVKIATGEFPVEAEFIEKKGLSGFGHDIYTYKKIIEYACKSAGILEGVYLLLKKKKSSRQFRIFDGKKKFLTTSEIYDIYAEKFSSLKKEYGELK